MPAYKGLLWFCCGSGSGYESGSGRIPKFKDPDPEKIIPDSVALAAVQGGIEMWERGWGGSVVRKIYWTVLTVSRDFLLLVFFMNQFPPSSRVSHQNRFEFFRKFSEIFASKGAPPVSTTPVANLPPVSITRRQFCRRYQRHGRQILPPVSLVLLIPVANLPPVSTTPVANNGNNIRLLRP